MIDPTEQDFHLISTHTNEHVHIHNVRDFPQAKLNSKLNVHLLSNQHGDLYFVFHNIVSMRTVSSITEKKIS